MATEKKVATDFEHRMKDFLKYLKDKAKHPKDGSPMFLDKVNGVYIKGAEVIRGTKCGV